MRLGYFTSFWRWLRPRYGNKDDPSTLGDRIRNYKQLRGDLPLIIVRHHLREEQTSFPARYNPGYIFAIQLPMSKWHQMSWEVSFRKILRDAAKDANIPHQASREESLSHDFGVVEQSDGCRYSPIILLGDPAKNSDIPKVSRWLCERKQILSTTW
jgi:hypothetical protein